MQRNRQEIREETDRYKCASLNGTRLVVQSILLTYTTASLSFFEIAIENLTLTYTIINV